MADIDGLGNAEIVSDEDTNFVSELRCTRCGKALQDIEGTVPVLDLVADFMRHVGECPGSCT